MEPSGRARAFGVFALSVAFHGAALYGMERAASGSRALEARLEALAARQKRDTVEFRFIEVPREAPPAKPSRPTPRIAERDSASRDGGTVRDPMADAPAQIPMSASDQITLLAGAASVPKPPSPAVPPKPASASAAADPTESEIRQPAKEERPPAPILPGADAPPRRTEPQRSESPRPAQEPDPGSQPQEPSAVQKEIFGADKILAQASRKRVVKGAALYGQVSFEATGSGMGLYMKNLKERIWAAWFPYVAFQYPRDFHGADAVIAFTVGAQGEVRSLKIEESQGSPAFALVCLEAIRRAAPYGELPQEAIAIVGKDEIEIKFGFHYR